MQGGGDGCAAVQVAARGSRRRFPGFPGSRVDLTQGPHLPVPHCRVQRDWLSWDAAAFNRARRELLGGSGRHDDLDLVDMGNNARARVPWPLTSSEGTHSHSSRLRASQLTTGLCCSPGGTGGRDVGCCRSLEPLLCAWRPNPLLGSDSVSHNERCCCVMVWCTPIPGRRPSNTET